MRHPSSAGRVEAARGASMSDKSNADKSVRWAVRRLLAAVDRAIVAARAAEEARDDLLRLSAKTEALQNDESKVGAN